MVTTTFVDEVTVIEPEWCNDVDALVYQGNLGTALNITAGATAAADLASIGYTAANGLELTGQGSTYDVALINDVGNVVAGVLTGTTTLQLIGALDSNDTTDATTDDIGAIHTLGGLGVTKTAWIGQDIVLDERADHAATSAAGSGIVWVRSDTPSSLIYTDDAAVDHALTSPIITGHIRAGNTQLWDGEGTLTGELAVHTDLTEDTWETVGPTGSGADNVWADMDRLPSNATILIVDCEATVSTGDASSIFFFIYATHGDDATPAASELSNQIFWYGVDHDADIAGNERSTARLYIPLGATNQDFNLNWKVTGLTDSEEIHFRYRGFMTD